MRNLDQLEKQFYERNDHGTIKIIETSKEGEAELTVHIENEAISFRIKEGNGFAYLVVKNTPDGIVFVKDSKSWTLHVFECKKTVSEKHWEKAKKQFAGGILHAHLLRGLLNVPDFSNIKVYTVYRNDKLLEKTPDSSLLRNPVGKEITNLPFQDWREGKLNLLWYENITHTPIQLDDEGKGEFNLNENI